MADKDVSIDISVDEVFRKLAESLQEQMQNYFPETADINRLETDYKVDQFGNPVLVAGGKVVTRDKSNCRHEWVEYTGLTECYSYCKHCDQKATSDRK